MISSWAFFKNVAVVCIVTSAISLSAQTNPESHSQPGEPIRHSFNFNGFEREYFIWLPRNYGAEQEYWGLVVVHGGGGNGRTFWLTKDIRLAADEIGLNAIVISPSFLKDDPNAERFPILGEGAFLKHLLEDVREKYQIKPKILLTGYSRGAQFTHRFALWNPNQIQACAPLAAGSWTTPDGRFLMYSAGEIEDPESYLTKPENSEGLPKAQANLFESRVAKVAGRSASSGAVNVPFLVMCGTEDERFEMAREFARSLKSCGYAIHTAWPKTPHGGRSRDEYRKEFKKYSRQTAQFFLHLTKDK